MGISTYVLSYRAELRTLAPTSVGYSRGWGYQRSPTILNVTVPKNISFQVTGAITFEKKESGWVPVQITSTREPNPVIDTIPQPQERRYTFP